MPYSNFLEDILNVEPMSPKAPDKSGAPLSSSIETRLSMIEARVEFSSFDRARLKLEAQ